jgi:hypothetical protein
VLYVGPELDTLVDNTAQTPRGEAC